MMIDEATTYEENLVIGVGGFDVVIKTIKGNMDLAAKELMKLLMELHKPTYRRSCTSSNIIEAAKTRTATFPHLKFVSTNLLSI